MSYHYIQDPQTIESLSFEMIRASTDLSRFNSQQAQVAMRIVHTCGLPEAAAAVCCSAAAVTAGLQALAANKPILCDVEMVVHGITRRFTDSPIECYINVEGVAERAKLTGQTRSMTAMQRWEGSLAGAIAVIGNAPTALFRLLEMIESGAPKPALIIGMPVGFVGAAESKQALWDSQPQHGCEVITLLGRQGGSAIASAVVNALARMQRGVYYQ